jgi:hypothetical protein
VRAGLVELVVALDLPAHAIEVGDLTWTDRGREIRQVEAVGSLGCWNAYHPATHEGLAGPERHIDVDDLSIEDKDLLVDESVEVGTLNEISCDAAAPDLLDPGLPAVLEANDEADTMLLTVANELEARIPQVE